MLAEVLAQLAPQADGLYLDGTVGGGGHAEAILQASAPHGRLLAVDRDAEALAEAGRRLAPFGDRVQLLHTRFDALPARWEELGRPLFAGILLDLGVSSHQLDRPERGFSFGQAGPLDMRMDPSSGPSAAQLLAGIDEDELTALLRRGEVPQARRLARALRAAQSGAGLASTADLARLVEESVGGRARSGRGGGRGRGGRTHHPATLVFQALRLAVNEELDALDRFLAWLPAPLAPGGRVVILSYHSLEDRRVKRTFQELSRGCICPPRLPVCACGREPAGRLLTRRGLHAAAAEVARNPRARSAVLRAWERNR